MKAKVIHDHARTRYLYNLQNSARDGDPFKPRNDKNETTRSDNNTWVTESLT